MSAKENLELSEKEKTELLGFFKDADLETLKAAASAIMMFRRAIAGQTPEPSDVISKLIDIKDKMQLSRFPTYPIMAKNIYLRLIHSIYGDPAKACLTWADFEASALVEYKGEGRKEYVEATKAAASSDSQNITFAMQQQAHEKRGLLRRREKKAESEFEGE